MLPSYPLSSPLTASLQVGWGSSELPADQIHKLSLAYLLEWQQLTPAVEFEVASLE